jgi:hypothetical protein
MSFQEKLENTILELLQQIGRKYSIPYDELESLYLSDSKKTDHKEISEIEKKVSPKTVKIEDILIGKKEEKKIEKKSSPKKSNDIDQDKLKSDPDLDPIKLNNYSLDELKGLCKRHSLKVSGKKADLIKRLQGKEGEEEEEKTTKKISPEKKPTKKQEQTETKILEEKITERTPTLNVRRNGFGNFEHQTTGLVLDPQTKCVYGKQIDDGSIADLTADDIDQCNKYKMNYILPENLNKNKKGLDDVKIEELEEKQEIFEEEEIEYEEIEYEEEEIEEEEIE